MKDSFSTRRAADVLPTEMRHRQGLCTFCDVAEGCALIGPSGMPVLECEEFRAIRSQGGAARENDPGAVGSDRKDHTDWSEKGLCGNCAIYDTCPFSKAEGGIWHCEEYR